MTAEWRYYGADDNNMRDPTRCGMPINPLLRESSYACKILSTYKSSYQMKRIKRYTDWQSMPYKEKAIYMMNSKDYNNVKNSRYTKNYYR